MSRGASISVENAFNKGLITEYTAMNFPEQAVTDADNVIFSEFGRVTRRQGIDAEAGYAIQSMSSVTDVEGAVVEYRWSSVSEDGAVTFVVQQLGNRIRFFSVEDGESLSSSMKSFYIDLSDYATPGNTQSSVAIDPVCFTDGRGYLFISHPKCDPIYVSYDVDSDTIEVSAINIQVRDFEVLDDGLDTDERPTVLSSLHKYNLFSQGWYADIRYGSSGGPVDNAVNAWRAEGQSDYPSNTDVWWYFTTVSQNSGLEYFDGLTIPIRTGLYGNTPAPNGHYIYDAFNINRTSKTGISGLPTESSNGARPAVCVFYAGRVCYAGTSAEKYSSKLYFSQTVRSDLQFGRCYQNNDPTSKEISDLLDTDGGVIELPRIESVVALKVVGDVLVVLGTNGIYTIRGDNEGPFRATSYTVSFVSTIGAVSNLSVVDIDGALTWWNYDGIYAFIKGQLGDFQVESLSKESIQSLIDDIPPANKDFVKGVHNKRERLVRWLYSDVNNTGDYEYNRILEFNTTSRAFYTHSVSLTSSPTLSGIISVYGKSVSTFLENVEVSGEIVTISTDEAVQVRIIQTIPNQEVFKFLVTGDISSGSTGLTYAEMNDTDLVDWASFVTNGVSYDSYGVTGYRIRGDILRKFNTTPVSFVLDNIDNGSVLIKSIWDYGSRESMPQELYRGTSSSDYIVKRIKMRGKGVSMQIKFQSVENNPFSIVGWSSYDTGGTAP